MEGERDAKKRIENCQDQDKTDIWNGAEQHQPSTSTNNHCNRSPINANVSINAPFKTWKFGTVNIRSGKEKDQGGKIYAITKQVAKLKLSFCCLQEVKSHYSGSKVIELDSGEKYEFY